MKMLMGMPAKKFKRRIYASIKTRRRAGGYDYVDLNSKYSWLPDIVYAYNFCMDTIDTDHDLESFVRWNRLCYLFGFDDCDRQTYVSIDDMDRSDIVEYIENVSPGKKNISYSGVWWSPASINDNGEPICRSCQCRAQRLAWDEGRVDKDRPLPHDFIKDSAATTKEEFIRCVKRAFNGDQDIRMYDLYYQGFDVENIKPKKIKRKKEESKCVSDYPLGGFESDMLEKEAEEIVCKKLSAHDYVESLSRRVWIKSFGIEADIVASLSDGRRLVVEMKRPGTFTRKKNIARAKGQCYSYFAALGLDHESDIAVVSDGNYCSWIFGSECDKEELGPCLLI